MNPAQAPDKLLFVSTFHWSSYEWTWLHQCTSVEQGMCLLSAHGVEHEVHRDDDKWSHVCRPEVSSGFSVIFCRWRVFRFALTSSTEVFTPCSLLPPQRGFSEFVVSPWHFGVPSAFGNMDLFPVEISTLLSHWFFVDRFLMRPSFPIPRYPLWECLLSKFHPRSMHI